MIVHSVQFLTGLGTWQTAVIVDSADEARAAGAELAKTYANVRRCEARRVRGVCKSVCYFAV